MRRCPVCKQKEHEWWSAEKDGGMTYEERELWEGVLERLYSRSRSEEFRDFLFGWMWDITVI